MLKDGQVSNFELSDEQIEKVLVNIAIPSCPAIVAEVMAELQKDDPDIRKLAHSMSADPGMVAVALKLANSPLFRVGEQTSSLLQALGRIGTRNINCVVVASALKTSMKGVPSAFIETFWSKTSAMALAAGLIARRQYGVAPDAAYTYALFHNAGQPLMLMRYPEYVQVMDSCRRTGQMLITAESTYFPCTHPIIGALLVRNWGLPAIVGQAIRFHHEPDVYDLPDHTLPGGAVSLIAVSHITEYLSHEMDCEPDLEVGEEHFKRALAHFGIANDDLDILRDLIIKSRES
ncbi:MAG: HDOD domain-containing protein [Iodobacter sp.]